MIPPCVQIYLLDDNKNIKSYVRIIIYFLAASFIAVGLNVNFSDDGLRHLAFANNLDLMKNWGEVFPHSLFGTYDPWYFWHAFLKLIINISSLESAHIVVNILSVFLLLIFIDSIFNIEMKKYKNTILLLTLILLSSVFNRYINLRPDLLSGFYVMSIYILYSKIGVKYRFVGIFIVSLVYLPMYYLFFVYTLAMAMYMFMMKDYKSMLSLVILTIVGFVLYYIFFGKEFLDILKYILTDEKLRNGILVGEGMPIFDILVVVNVKILFVVYLIGTLYLKFRYQKFLLNNALLTMLITLSLLWIDQLRYTSLFAPLFYILAISFLINLSMKDIKIYLRKIEILLFSFFKGYAKNSRNTSFIIIFALFVSFESGMIMMSDYKPNNKTAKEYIKEFQNQDYNNSTILFNTLDVASYFALYANPSIKEVPSCSIGWDDGDKRYQELYRKMIKKEINENEIIEISNYINANYLILKLPINLKNDFNPNILNKGGYKISKIFQDYLIFERNQ